jgi:hypothetical protein
MAPHWKCGSGQPVAGSNPALSATIPNHGAHRRGRGTLPDAVLGGELAVPCTCNPLQQG